MPHCQARFKLPQSKMKPGGTKVRCTKCKIVFMVTPPQDDVSPEDTKSGNTTEDTREESDSGFAEGFGKDFDNADFFSDGDEGDDFLLGEAAFDDDGSDPFALDEEEAGEQADLNWTEDSVPSFLNSDPEPAEDLPVADEVFGGEGEVSGASGQGGRRSRRRSP
ncbi:hypothetical protein A7E78_13180 [Syntrophotalea acetylenivorans]|uniref:Zinc finger/thioredoxin putative domain-containing protein n=1 Tax=Syntrophotalea acetylenivorans TaxID=1842532 RepID=A0A1L3GS59_9BACT|nr:zinc-ribbon domain-containing protein [Syntrophotalea acetylenivorans]APG28700.1 hypothetical protein A7E78_13180 [Syntrophotalea acetylenivorans]